VNDKKNSIQQGTSCIKVSYHSITKGEASSYTFFTNLHLIKNLNFSKERIAERVVHAKELAKWILDVNQ
jgi:catalase